MRILHVTTEFPWPATSGGTVRTKSELQIICSLPEVEEVTLLTITESSVSDEDRRGLEEAIPKLRVLPSVFHPIHLFDHKRYVPKVVALRLLGMPYVAGKWDSRDYRAALRRELRTAPIDVVYIDHLGLAIYVRDIKAERPFARTVLEQHNVESDFFRQFANRQKNPVKRLLAVEEARLSVKFERKAVQSVDAVVAISEADKKAFAAMAGIDAHVVPVVMKFDRKERPDPGRPHFCYVGNLRWAPNVAGLDWFCQEVWPLVKKRVPEATLDICGIGLKAGAPPPEKWKGPGITVVGFVENLEPIYDRSIAMVSPVQGGGPGIRMKLLEGLRAGMPVVTTTEGAFGLPLLDGIHCFISNDPEGTADRVARLAKEPALREKLRTKGFDFLETHNSLASAQAVMRRVLGIPAVK